MVKNKLVLPVMMACASGTLPALAHAASSSVVIANYRFPDSLYALLEQGIKIPVYLVNTRPHSAQQGNHEGTANEYVRIGDVTLFAKDLKLGLRDVQVQESDNGIRLSKRCGRYCKALTISSLMTRCVFRLARVRRSNWIRKNAPVAESVAERLRGEYSPA